MIVYGTEIVYGKVLRTVHDMEKDENGGDRTEDVV